MSDAKKPSTAEEEYFAREELKRREQTNIKKGHEEREKLKALHWMRCPKCGSELHEVAFRDVSIDRCEDCGGVFLDRGELEQLSGSEDNVIGAILQYFKKD
ncbi:MAG: zf-TFIIB domain-containing protein [Deltaproteobacteria bacterium]|nr:zf-TFIIB domain-containing protein [Deltaproteobacteria bacterium]